MLHLNQYYRSNVKTDAEMNEKAVVMFDKAKFSYFISAI